jgi:hypothetical protein
VRKQQTRQSKDQRQS